LIEKYRISNFTRYPTEVLRAMSEGYVQERNKDKIAISLFSKTDWNGAIDNKSTVIKEIYDNANVYVYEVEDDKAFVVALKELGEECKLKNKKIDLLFFDAHGSKELLQLGWPYVDGSTVFMKENIKKLGELRDYIAPDAQVVMGSCSPAEGGGDSDNIARDFASAWPGREIFAANKNVATQNVFFND